MCLLGLQDKWLAIYLSVASGPVKILRGEKLLNSI